MNCPDCEERLRLIPRTSDWACANGHRFTARQLHDRGLIAQGTDKLYDAIMNCDVERAIAAADTTEFPEDFETYVSEGRPMGRIMSHDEATWVYRNLK